MLEQTRIVGAVRDHSVELGDRRREEIIRSRVTTLQARRGDQRLRAVNRNFRRGEIPRPGVLHGDVERFGKIALPERGSLRGSLGR